MVHATHELLRFHGAGPEGNGDGSSDQVWFSRLSFRDGLLEWAHGVTSLSHSIVLSVVRTYTPVSTEQHVSVTSSG